VIWRTALVERHRGLHAGHLLQRPGEAVASTSVPYFRQPSLGLDDHGELSLDSE
jgi:hypothetical protein